MSKLGRVAAAVGAVGILGGAYAAYALYTGVRDVRNQARQDAAVLEAAAVAQGVAAEQLAAEPAPWRMRVEADGTVTSAGYAVDIAALAPPAGAVTAEIEVAPGAPHQRVAAVVDAVRSAGVREVSVHDDAHP